MIFDAPSASRSTGIAPKGSFSCAHVLVFLCADPVFEGATEGMLLVLLACISGPTRMVTIAGTVPAGHDSRTWHSDCNTLSADCLQGLRPSQRGRLPVRQRPEASEGFSAWGCQLCPFPPPPDSSLVSPSKEHVRLAAALSFATAAQRTPFPPDHPPLVASRADACPHRELYIFAFLNSCCRRAWLPVHLNLGAD